MYQYFSLLYNKYRKPILPIAIFSYNENRKERNEFTIAIPFFHVLTFQFLMVELRKLNWRSYVKSNNPIAAALLSKMGYTDKEKVEVKKEFLRMLIKMEANPAKMALINGFFEKYLILNKTEEEILMKEINQLRPDETDLIIKLPNSWRDKGIEEGREAGIKEGKKQTAIEMLKEGASVEFIARVTKLTEDEIIDLKRLL